MTVAGTLIWAAVVGLAVYAAYAKREPSGPKILQVLIIGGGVVFPTVALAGLLAYGLWLIPTVLAPAPAGSLTVRVTAEQWWWRVHYRTGDEDGVELANEIHLPVGRPVEFLLDSPDVIHSFWIPSLGGKVDMIPGRQNRLALQPLRKGVFRGVCAEYCGTSHALMAFPVVVQSERDFQHWLDQQALSAAEPSTPVLIEGQKAFVENGCGACHSVRGTSARGLIGPDLTHIGSRLSVGAGTLKAGHAQLRRFIAHTLQVKPEARMPAFDMLPERDLEVLAAYLESLR